MAIKTSILTGGSNNHETTSEEANQLTTDFISEGVVDAITNTSGVAPMTGAYAVNAQGTPDMTVAVSTGVAYVTATPSSQGSQTLRVKNSASTNVTISANSSGSTKYDWLYLSVSAANAANPNSAADNVTTLVTSRSSSASSDDGTPPSFGLVLAVITVANAATSITNGNITDKRVITGFLQNSNPYKFRAYRNASYTTTSATATRMPFDTESFDTNGNFDIATNIGRYTVPVSGFYQVNANISSDHNGFLTLFLYKNGTQIGKGGSDFYDPNQFTAVSYADLVQLTAGDYIEIFYYVDGAVGVEVGSGAQTRFSGYLVCQT